MISSTELAPKLSSVHRAKASQKRAWMAAVCGPTRALHAPFKRHEALDAGPLQTEIPGTSNSSQCPACAPPESNPQSEANDEARKLHKDRG